MNPDEYVSADPEVLAHEDVPADPEIASLEPSPPDPEVPAVNQVLADPEMPAVNQVHADPEMPALNQVHVDLEDPDMQVLEEPDAKKSAGVIDEELKVEDKQAGVSVPKAPLIEPLPTGQRAISKRMKASPLTLAPCRVN